MEYIGGAIALLLLLWACSGNRKGSQERYSIKETGDERYCEVIDNTTESVVFVGTRNACENYLQEHSSQ